MAQGSFDGLKAYRMCTLFNCESNGNSSATEFKETCAINTRRIYHTVAIHGAVGTRLLPITLDLFTTALIASASNSSSLLHGLRRRVWVCLFIYFSVGLGTVGWRVNIGDLPVTNGQRPGVVLGHFRRHDAVVIIREGDVGYRVAGVGVQTKGPRTE